MVYLGDLVNNCSDYSFISILVVVKRVMEMIQVVVPIVLLISCIWGLIKLLINPDDKKGLPSMRNKVMAAVICIFIPFCVNLVLSWTENSFSVSACWKTAYEYKAQLDNTGAYDVSTSTGKRKKVQHGVDDYKFNGATNNGGAAGSGGGSTGSANPNVNGTAKGQEIVRYALSFVGKKYVYGGGHGANDTLEGIYAQGGGVDCSGFVRLVYKHFGIGLSGTTDTQLHDGRAVSYSEAQAGDLIVYSGHVAIFMGDGQKIVHASNSQPFPKGGIKISDNAQYRSILGVRRII